MSVTPQGFDTLASLLKTRSGLSIGPEKLYLLETRLLPILRRENLQDLTALAQRLRCQASASGKLADDVVEAMTTGETMFFRDRKPFQHLRTVSLPSLAAARPAGTPLRIWSAATSSGQEAYSLAMLLADERETLGGRRTEIVGTDISGERIAIARGGVYAQLEVQRGLPVQMLLRHFRKEGPNWRISQEMRGMVEFREWNLLSALRPLGEFDIVFCRNVLSCFDQQTRARVLKEIAARMAPDGFLYVGDAETVVGITSRLVPMANERAVYRVAGAVTMAA